MHQYMWPEWYHLETDIPSMFPCDTIKVVHKVNNDLVDLLRKSIAGLCLALACLRGHSRCGGHAGKRIRNWDIMWSRGGLHARCTWARLQYGDNKFKCSANLVDYPTNFLNFSSWAFGHSKMGKGQTRWIMVKLWLVSWLSTRPAPQVAPSQCWNTVSVSASATELGFQRGKGHTAHHHISHGRSAAESPPFPPKAPLPQIRCIPSSLHISLARVRWCGPGIVTLIGQISTM